MHFDQHHHNYNQIMITVCKKVVVIMSLSSCCLFGDHFLYSIDASQSNIYSVAIMICTYTFKYFTILVIPTNNRGV